MTIRGPAIIITLLAGLTACATYPTTTSTRAATAGSAGVSIGQCTTGASRGEIDYPAGWFERLAAAERRTQPSDELLGGLDTAPAVSDKDAKPDQAPAVAYPPTAAQNRIEGICEVLFDTTPQGRPTNMVAACSNPLFLASATQSIAGVRIAPRIQDGQPVGRQGVVYPLLYCLE